MKKSKGTYSPIGRRLRSAREVMGISQKSLGIEAGIDQFSASARINQYENDKHIPDYLTAMNLAKVLSIPVTYLYADDDQLAEIILLFSSSEKSIKKEIIMRLRQANK